MQDKSYDRYNECRETLGEFYERMNKSDKGFKALASKIRTKQKEKKQKSQQTFVRHGLK